MPAADKFYDHLISLLQRAKTREAQDELLDIWVDATTRATEWDADQWGFDESWCTEARRLMEARIKAANKSKKSTV